MKTLFGIGLIILGIVSFFRYLTEAGIHSFPELIGVLIGLSIMIVPGVLLIKNDEKNKSNSNEK
ncbi:MAG: hypothetical protein IM568_06400 [Flavobacterium sp.]|nr:hypothetical protein [Flavobacterium sp.]